MSNGVTKFDVATMSFEAVTCWALALSIFNYFSYFMHIIVAYHFIYQCANRGNNVTSLCCSLLLRQEQDCPAEHFFHGSSTERSGEVGGEVRVFEPI